MKEQSQPYPCFTGVPNFFRYCVADARTGRNGCDYSVPGQELARHTYDLLSGAYDLDDPDEVDRRYQELEECLAAGDQQGVLRWYARNFPKCMDLIPPKRQLKFAEGVFGACEEGIMQ